MSKKDAKAWWLSDEDDRSLAWPKFIAVTVALAWIIVAAFIWWGW